MIVLKTEDHIWVIEIRREEVLNCLNRKTLDELADILIKVKEDESCRAVVITGMGEKAFSAGADIHTFIEEVKRPLGGKEWSEFGQKVFGILDRLGKPSLAAINGLTMGGGFELALACTFRIASKNAVFAFPEVSLGLLPGWGGTVRLVRLIGKTKALELILTGEKITADEAFNLGIVNKVVPPEQLMFESINFLKKIIKHSPSAIRLVLEAAYYADDLSLQEAMYLESSLGGLLCTTEEVRESLSAFLERKKKT